MPRFFPPHLMVLFGLLILVVWMLLVRYFQRSVVLQSFVAEIMGDETPELAFRKFILAKHRLESHLANTELGPQLRHQIEAALGHSCEQESAVAESPH